MFPLSLCNILMCDPLAAVCKDIYTEMKNKHGFGGTECPSAKTLDSCKEACIANTSCVAIDFVANKSECWIHMVDKDNPVTIGDAVGINHYQLVRCARGKSTKFFTTGTGMWCPSEKEKAVLIMSVHVAQCSHSCSALRLLSC